VDAHRDVALFGQREIGLERGIVWRDPLVLDAHFPEHGELSLLVQSCHGLDRCRALAQSESQRGNHAIGGGGAPALYPGHPAFNRGVAPADHPDDVAPA